MKHIFLFMVTMTATVVNAQDSNWYCETDGDNINSRWYNSEIGNQKALIIYPKEKANSNLLVFIHGDSPFGNPVYQYHISKSISEITNSITVAILRPGYKDGCGDASEGIRGLTMGDNYTEEVVNALASVISSIEKEENTTQTIVMGHSGGAALTVLLAESKPGLIDQAILVACPCNLTKWRKSMQDLTGNANWSNPMEGLSPIDGIYKLDLGTKIRLYVGENDVVAPPFLTSEFYEKTNELGVDVSMKIIPKEDHETVLKDRHLLTIMNEVGLLKE